MWTRSYSARVSGLTAEQIWNVWIDVDRWTAWQDDIESAKIAGEFAVGNTFMLRPKGGPDVRIKIIAADKPVNFTDLTAFPLAKMTGSHDFIQHGDEIELRTTITVQGPLSFLWTHLVAKNIVKDLPAQTARLIARVRALHERTA